jgi:hypothetical protein
MVEGMLENESSLTLIYFAWTERSLLFPIFFPGVVVSGILAGMLGMNSLDIRRSAGLGGSFVSFRIPPGVAASSISEGTLEKESSFPFESSKMGFAAVARGVAASRIPGSTTENESSRPTFIFSPFFSLLCSLPSGLLKC